nr:hypothetical protein [Tanacetum cinerariifolium]
GDIKFLEEENPSEQSRFRILLVKKLQYTPWKRRTEYLSQEDGSSAGLSLKILNESSIEAGVTKETVNTLDGSGTPKPMASARKKKSDSASSTTPPTPTPTTTVESAPRLSATAKGKQPSRATTPIEPTDVQRTEAKQLKIVLKRSRQEMHISQQSGSGTDEGTGSKPGVPDVPSDDSEEELSWNSSDDEDVGGHEEGKKSDESDDDRGEGMKMMMTMMKRKSLLRVMKRIKRLVRVAMKLEKVKVKVMNKKLVTPGKFWIFNYYFTVLTFRVGLDFWIFDLL